MINFLSPVFQGPPIIVPSAPNSKVIAGRSITLKCTHSRGDVLWYKQGSDKSIETGQELTLPEVSSKDEGTYYCASQNGLKGSIKVFVIGEFFLSPLINSFPRLKKVQHVVEGIV